MSSWRLLSICPSWKSKYQSPAGDERSQCSISTEIDRSNGNDSSRLRKCDVINYVSFKITEWLLINMFEKAYEFDNDVIFALEWILFMILGNGHATSSTSTRSPSSGKFSQILTLDRYVTKCQKIFLNYRFFVLYKNVRKRYENVRKFLWCQHTKIRIPTVKV